MKKLHELSWWAKVPIASAFFAGSAACAWLMAEKIADSAHIGMAELHQPPAVVHELEQQRSDDLRWLAGSAAGVLATATAGSFTLRGAWTAFMGADAPATSPETAASAAALAGGGDVALLIVVGGPVGSAAAVLEPRQHSPLTAA